MKLACIFLASGHSTRFGRDKLTFPVNGKPLCVHAFESLPPGFFEETVVVTRDPGVAQLAEEHSFRAVMNRDTTNDPAITIRLGIEALSIAADGVMFCVCDMPCLRPESIQAMAEEFAHDPSRIVRLSWQGRMGNPVLFPAALLDELRSLPAGKSGRYVIEQNPEPVRAVEALEERELHDIDTLEDLARVMI